VLYSAGLFLHSQLLGKSQVYMLKDCHEAAYAVT
jgi:hypothetical protein